MVSPPCFPVTRFSAHAKVINRAILGAHVSSVDLPHLPRGNRSYGPILRQLWG
jgi:hypothetical protein